MQFVDLTGQPPYGQLTVLRQAESGRSGAAWWCECTCGNITRVTSNNLRTGHTQSCGCLKVSVNTTKATTHGLSDHPLYRIWAHMRQRCLNPTDKKWHRYGGRGITICPRWDDFAKFVADMGPRPPGTTLDRRENNGPYSPENCRWATPKVQGDNTCNTVYLTYNGETKTLTTWARGWRRT